MKLFSRPNSFFDAITLVIHFNYVLGLRVFEYPRGHPRSVLSLIYLLIISVIYSRGTFRIDEYFVYTKPLKIDLIMYRIVGCIYLVTVILKMIMGWWHSKRVAVCYKKIFEIDKTLRQLGLTVNYDRMYFMMIGVIIVWFLLIIIHIMGLFLYLQTHTSTLHMIHMMLAAVISLTVHYINDFEFYVLSRYLQTKFELINHLLRETIRNLTMQETILGIFEVKDYAKLMNFEQPKNIPFIKIIFQRNQRIYSPSNFVLRKQSPSTFQIETHISFPLKAKSQKKCWNQSHNISTVERKIYVHLIQILKQVHLELCKVSKLICSAFGIQIATEIGLVIVFIVDTSYYFYCRYFVQVWKLKNEEIYLPIILSLLNFLKIFFLSRVCKNAADEGNKIAELIHITYGSNTDIDIQEEMQQFRFQILHSPVIFNVFGLTMDNHILSMILKSVTIYMVIMIQVGSSLQSNNAIKDLHF